MKTVSGKEISKIGIGSFGIGGRGHRDVALTERAEDQIYIGCWQLGRGKSHFSDLRSFSEPDDGRSPGLPAALAQPED